MRRFFFFLFLLFSAGISFSQGNAADKAEMTKVMQKSIDAPELQQYFTVNAGSYKQLYVFYSHPVFIPTDLSLSKGDKSILFKEVPAVSGNETDDFFIFRSVQLNETTASVVFDFYYDSAAGQKMIKVTINLQKAGGSWNISETQIRNN